MKLNNRSYKVIIKLANGSVVIIQPELTIDFDITKSVSGGLNVCRFKVYNLSDNKRQQLTKDKEQRAVMPFDFYIGYQDKIELVFSGNVYEAFSERSGTDFITTISSVDGGFDQQNSYTSKTVTTDGVNELLEDMPNTTKGHLPTSNIIERARVLVGSTYDLIKSYVKEDETIFIENSTLNILKDTETLGKDPVKIHSGMLLGTPKKKNSRVTFSTLINPAITIGNLVELSSTDARLDNIYKVQDIRYRGSNYNSDWEQVCTCMLMSNYDKRK